MRFRAGLVMGFAAGFYFGAMAGQERYEQINRMLHRVKRSDAVDLAGQKAKAVVELGVERARDLVGTTFGRDAGGANPAERLARTSSSSGTGWTSSKAGNGDRSASPFHVGLHRDSDRAAILHCLFMPET